MTMHHASKQGSAKPQHRSTKSREDGQRLSLTEQLRLVVLFVAYKMIRYRQMEKPWPVGESRWGEFTVQLAKTSRRAFYSALVTHPHIDGRVVLVEANPEKVSESPVPSKHKVMVYLETPGEAKLGGATRRSKRTGQVRYWADTEEIGLSWVHDGRGFQEVVRLPVGDVVNRIEQVAA